MPQRDDSPQKPGEQRHVKLPTGNTEAERPAMNEAEAFRLNSVLRAAISSIVDRVWTGSCRLGVLLTAWQKGHGGAG